MPYPYKSVFLKPALLENAERAGRWRVNHNWDRYAGGSREERTSDRTRTEERYYSDAIIGAMAELAWAVWQRKPWNPAEQTGRRDGVKKADFDGDKEIRAAYSGAKHLLLQKQDPDDRLYIMAIAVVGCDCVNFVGYQTGAVVKELGQFRDKAGSGAPCYWFPKDQLRNIFDLPGLVYTEQEKKNP